MARCDRRRLGDHSAASGRRFRASPSLSHTSTSASASASTSASSWYGVGVMRKRSLVRHQPVSKPSVEAPRRDLVAAFRDQWLAPCRDPRAARGAGPRRRRAANERDEFAAPDVPLSLRITPPATLLNGQSRADVLTEIEPLR